MSLGEFISASVRSLVVINDGAPPSLLRAKVLLRLQLGLYSFWLRAVNLWSRRPVIGSAEVDVSLTTYGERTGAVWKTLETIGRGDLQPRRLVLWHADADVVRNPPPTLKRLVKRGLTLRHCRDYGPHKKYFPYVQEVTIQRPLVTADDDVYYPRGWLAGLMAVYRPDQVAAYRAHVICDARYLNWPPCSSTEPAENILPTGVSGVIYPPSVLEVLRNQGDEFMRVCPRADDFWLHYAAVASGLLTRQVRETSATWWPSRLRDKGLWSANQFENDVVGERVRTAWLGSCESDSIDDQAEELKNTAE